MVNMGQLWIVPVVFRLSGVALFLILNVASMEGTELSDSEILKALHRLDARQVEREV